MKVVKPDNLALLPRVLVEAETCVLSVAAMAFFSLEDPPSLGSESEMWECVTQILPEDEVLDSGLPKPRAEFLVYGHAFDQGGRGVAGVDVEVGTCRKRLHVFGERFWRDREYTRAEPFTKLPLDWEHAYGGPEFPPNPVGKGHIPMKGEFQNVHPLPNVVAADHTPGSSRDQVEPVGLRAISETWPQRRQYEGTYDQAWFDHRWPGRPLDYDPEHACAAPFDQRFPGYLKGDEPVSVTGMHPSLPQVRGTLPGVRARMFVKRLQDGQEAFQELKTNLDTVWLFPEFQRGVALFRGVTATTDEECEDISTLMAAFEPLETAPLPVTHYMELLEEAAPAGATPEPAQPEQPEDPEEPQASAKQAAPPDLSEMEKEVGALQAKVTDHLKSIGVTEKQAMDFMVQKEKEQALRMEEAMAILGGADAGLEEMVANLEKATTAHLDKLGVSREQALEFLRDKEHPPDFKIKEIQDGLQQTLDNNPGLDAETRGKITEAIAAYGQLVILLGSSRTSGMSRSPSRSLKRKRPFHLQLMKRSGSRKCPSSPRSPVSRWWSATPGVRACPEPI